MAVKSYKKIGVAWKNTNSKTGKNYLSASLNFNETTKLRFNLEKIDSKKSKNYPDYIINVKRELAEVNRLKIPDDNNAAYVKVGAAWNKIDHGKKHRVLMVLDYIQDKYYINLHPYHKKSSPRQPDYYATINRFALKDLKEKYYSSAFKKLKKKSNKLQGNLSFKLFMMKHRNKLHKKKTSLKSKYDFLKPVKVIPLIILFVLSSYAIIKLPDLIKNKLDKKPVYIQEITDVDNSFLKKALTTLDKAFENYNIYYATVKKVVDGDTIELSDKTRIRYLGVNTPEIDHKTGSRDEPGARRAWRTNARLVNNKRIILVVPKFPEYTYGRLLAYVFAPVENRSKYVYLNISQFLLDQELGYTTYGKADRNLPASIELKKLQQKIIEIGG